MRHEDKNECLPYGSIFLAQFSGRRLVVQALRTCKIHTKLSRSSDGHGYIFHSHGNAPYHNSVTSVCFLSVSPWASRDETIHETLLLDHPHPPLRSYTTRLFFQVIPNPGPTESEIGIPRTVVEPEPAIVEAPAESKGMEAAWEEGAAGAGWTEQPGQQALSNVRGPKDIDRHACFFRVGLQNEAARDIHEDVTSKIEVLYFFLSKVRAAQPVYNNETILDSPERAYIILIGE